MVAYPNAEDYFRVVQRPDLVFRTPALRRARFAVHPTWGTPMLPASGNAAVVFKAEVEGTDQALRFFIKEDASSVDRYTELGHHFATHGLGDCVAGTRWIEDAIEVNGRTWPVIQMEWIDGRTLDAYVGHLAERGDVGALDQLAEHWRHHVRRLQEAEYAHGDLQHGNVLVDSRSALRLVDFDGSWIAGFSTKAPPRETGHPNYQRTGRVWGRWMDTFPALVIYTGLLALSRRPEAWKELHNGENILFSHGDFAPPLTTKAWTLLRHIPDPEMRHVVDRLAASCEPRWKASASLEDVLAQDVAVVTGREIPAVHPPDDPDAPWWVRAAADVPGLDAGRGTLPVASPGPGSWMPPNPPVTPADMPPPPPRSQPLGAGSPPPRFATSGVEGVSWFATPPGPAPPPPPATTRPAATRPATTPPGARSTGPKSRLGRASAVWTAIGVAVLIGLLAAGAAGRNGGVAFVVTGLIVLGLMLLVLLPQTRRPP